MLLPASAARGTVRRRAHSIRRHAASLAAWRREVRGRSRALTPLDAASAQSVREVVLEHRGFDARRNATEALRRAHALIDEVLDNADAIVHVTDAHSGETLLLKEHARWLLGDDAEALLARLPIPRASSPGATHDVEDRHTRRCSTAASSRSSRPGRGARGC